MRLIAIILGAGVVSSFTDWFFAGDWIHRRFTYPEIWRQGAEAKAIALTSPLPFLTCGVFAYVAARLGLRSVSGDQTRGRGMADRGAVMSALMPKYEPKVSIIFSMSIFYEKGYYRYAVFARSQS